MIMAHRYLESGEYSDFMIRCRGHEWKVHQVIISAVSPYFKRLTSGPFKVV
jgi:BTB/POZ domain